jgi:hypothetical protein
MKYKDILQMQSIPVACIPQQQQQQESPLTDNTIELVSSSQLTVDYAPIFQKGTYPHQRVHSTDCIQYLTGNVHTIAGLGHKYGSLFFYRDYCLPIKRLIFFLQKDRSITTPC